MSNKSFVTICCSFLSFSVKVDAGSYSTSISFVKTSVPFVILTVYFPAFTFGANPAANANVFPIATFGAWRLKYHSTVFIPFCLPAWQVAINLPSLSKISMFIFPKVCRLERKYLIWAASLGFCPTNSTSLLVPPNELFSLITKGFASKKWRVLVNISGVTARNGEISSKIIIPRPCVATTKSFFLGCISM